MRRPADGRGTDEASGRRFLADDRAQTVLDFGMAVGLFLVAVVFVLGVVPGMFDPFTAGTDTGVGDRVASSLARDALGDPSTPSVLDEQCTWAFFEQMQNGTDASTDCRFDTTADDPESLFGVSNTTSLNVSITDFEGTPVVLDTGGSDRTLTAGDPLPTRSSVTTARRTVYLDGRTYRLEVNVW